MRPVLRAVLQRPGTLYQPLCCVPVPVENGLDGDVQTMAEAEGLPVTFWRPDLPESSIPSAGRRVIAVTTEHLLAWWTRDGVTATAPGVQVIIWGPALPDDLPPPLTDWIDAGLPFDPTDVAQHATHDWSMGPTIARCAKEPGRLYNPVVLIGAPSAGTVLAQEALLRLEAAGLTTVLLLGSAAAQDARWATWPAGTAVVWHLSDALTPSAATACATALAQAIERHVQVVLVVDAEFVDVLPQAPALEAVVNQGMHLLLTGPAASPTVTASSERRQYFHRQADWPALSDMLVGAPNPGPTASRTLTGRLNAAGPGGVTFAAAVQFAVQSRQHGHLVVWGPDRLSVLEIAEGQIVDARLLGDPWTSATLAAARGLTGPAGLVTATRLLLEDRACVMASWTGARAAWLTHPGLPAHTHTPAGLSEMALILEASRRQDEATRYPAAVQNLQSVWRRTDRPLSSGRAAGLTPVDRLAAALDGQTSTETLATRFGVLPDEARGALYQWRQAGMITEVPGASAAPAAAPVLLETVVQALWQGGLGAEAAELLRAARAAGAISVGAQFLLGHGQALLDPQDALTVFAAVRETLRALPRPTSAESQWHLDACLNHALLQVRSGRGAPDQVWTTVRAEMDVLTRVAKWSARHALVTAELALRADEDATAAHVLDTLQSVPEAADLVRQLRQIQATAATAVVDR